MKMDYIFTIEVNEEMKVVNVAVNEVESMICLTCSKTFVRKDALVRHTKTVHDNNEFPCSKCNLKYDWEDNLVRHMKRVHDVTEQKEKFQCPNYNNNNNNKL